MITILGILAKLSIILGFIATFFFSVSDLVTNNTTLNTIEDMVNLGNPRVKLMLALVSLLYLIIFFVSYLNKLTKYSQNRKVKNKSGEIIVTIKTINDTAKEFLDREIIIKSSKVKSHPKGNSVLVEATVDMYNVDSLNEKLEKIQERLSKYLMESTGITMNKKSRIKLRKILDETVIERKIIEEPAKTLEISGNSKSGANENPAIANELEAAEHHPVEAAAETVEAKPDSDTRIDEIVNENISEKKERKWKF